MPATDAAPDPDASEVETTGTCLVALASFLQSSISEPFFEYMFFKSVHFEAVQHLSKQCKVLALAALSITPEAFDFARDVTLRKVYLEPIAEGWCHIRVTEFRRDGNSAPRMNKLVCSTDQFSATFS